MTTTTAPIIRHATKADAAALAEHLNNIRDENLDTVPKRLRTSETDQTAFLEIAEANGHAFFLIAMMGETLAGMLELWAGEQTYNRHVGVLGMSVSNGFRRQGIGAQLLDTAIIATKTWPGFCRIELQCVPWNAPAVALYHSRGFEIEATKRKAIDFRGKPEDILLMSLIW